MPRWVSTFAAILAAVAVLGLIVIGAQGAEAKLSNAPKGLKFYKPPKKLPRQHGSLIWARSAGGLVPLANARYTKLLLYTSRTRRIA